LTILEYINISGKSVDEARELILSREQHYLDSLSPEYNILSTAGNILGYKHTEETIALISQANSGENHPLFGKKGENHPLFGKTHTLETKAKISEAMSGENHPNYGKTHSAETLLKMSKLNLVKIILYLEKLILLKQKQK
jgi:group I intron endonuclease